MCDIMDVNRSSLYYKQKPKKQNIELEHMVIEIFIIPPILLSNIVDIFVRLSRANHKDTTLILKLFKLYGIMIMY